MQSGRSNFQGGIICFIVSHNAVVMIYTQLIAGPIKFNIGGIKIPEFIPDISFVGFVISCQDIGTNIAMNIFIGCTANGYFNGNTGFINPRFGRTKIGGRRIAVGVHCRNLVMIDGSVGYICIGVVLAIPTMANGSHEIPATRGKIKSTGAIDFIGSNIGFGIG